MRSGGRLAAVICAALLAFATQAGASELSTPDEPVPSADLEISLTAVYDPAVAGRVQIYDVEVVNRGPAIARDVLFDYEPLAQAWIAGVRPTETSCSMTGRSLACDLGALAAGQTARLNLATYIDARLDDLLSANVLISSTTADPDESNNEASVQTPTVPARAATAVRTSEDSYELVVSVKESDTTIGLVFLDPSGEERRTSVSSPGYRAVALTRSVSPVGQEAVVALGFGFDGSAVLDVVDAASATSVGRHPLRDGLVPIDLISMPPRGQTAAARRTSPRSPAVAVLAYDPSASAACVLVIDLASGAERSSLCPPVPTGGTFPVGLARLRDGSRLAMLTASLTATTLHVATAPADDWEDSVVLTGEGLPLDLSAAEGEFVVLNREPEAGSITRVRLADNASFTSTRTLAHARPEALTPLSEASDEAAELLAVAGRQSESTWLEFFPRGGVERQLAAGGEGYVCLGLVALPQARDSTSSLIALIYERPGEPTEVALFSLDELEQTFVLP